MKVDQNILVLGICIAMQTQIIQGCRNGWLQFENSCYLLSKDAATWAEASMICIDLESRLAAVETADESNFLKAEAHRLNAKSFWLDGTDLEVENVWRWTVNGNKLVYLDWGGHEPNQGTSANCLTMWQEFGYRWADEPCRNVYHFVCEKRTPAGDNEIIG